MVKIVKNPGNGRLNNLNDPVLNVLISQLHTLHLSISTHVVIERTSNLRQKSCIISSITLGDKDHSGNSVGTRWSWAVTVNISSLFWRWYGSWKHGQKAEWIPSQSRYSCSGEMKNSSHCRKLNTSRAALSDYLLPCHHRIKSITTFKAKLPIHFFKTDPYLLSVADTN